MNSLSQVLRAIDKFNGMVQAEVQKRAAIQRTELIYGGVGRRFVSPFQWSKRPLGSKCRGWPSLRQTSLARSPGSLR